ncbi:hypothetical protein L3X38_002002 [Prunus dulcis]|uniref:CCHC-type domain-containing protein n=1 Tax=Prunus dulcis TaxID=3755 RepID=A0AAD4WT36_PRUDU|nr:hypothetical protein L3X38_002002 [Prunus dulcis]
MEEGSPGVFLKNYRFAKRSRADSGHQDGLVSDANPDLMMAHDLNPGQSLVKNIGIDVNSLDTNYDELNDDEDVVISQGDRGPSIQFSEKAMSRLCKPWKNALIVKLLGRSHTYNYLHDRLQQKWSLKGGWKLVDLVNDYFVVKFELEEDLEFVLTGGPWIIAGQYLVLQKWRPGFCPATAHITRMAAWIRVSAIHLECFDVWALKRIGNLLGKLLKIDALTTSQNRGKFARMCVELDLTKPLEAFVQINQEWYNIEYEGLPDICYLCGRYGHKREHCEKRNSAPVAVPGEGQSSVVEDVLEGNVAMNNEELLENLRGPWMNVPARRRPKAMHKDQGGRINGVRTQGSRFDALHGVSENFGQKEVIGNGVDGQCVIGERDPATSDVGLGKKVWTKSKAVKSDVRVALNDISNKPQQDKRHLTAAARKKGGAKSPGFGNLIARDKLVIGGKRVESSLPLLDKVANWCSCLPSDITIPNLFPRVNSLHLHGLLRHVTAEEIKDSLFNIGSLKAPGVDGFPASFYQFNWDICAPDIVDMVLKVFQDCLIPKDLNYTLITLVPKISPNQVSFVPGRHITDNILIAQEMMCKFRVSKGKKGFFAWKIDLSKAYDRLNWKFIESVLEGLELPAHYIKLIMSCVNSVRYQVCVNGELTEAFLPSNGIRQGDPLSPYLFVLCIEKLSHIIFDSVNRKCWKPVKTSQSGPAVSHLFFADDLVLFAEASIKQARVMKSCLDLFCQASGQLVNFDKSAIFCSPNTNRELAREMSGICGSPLTDNLGRYLGMPLLHSRVTKGTFMGIVDKVHKRLASWKSKLLSFAGRTTLIQAVMSAMPVYAMQTAKLPMSTCEDLDKLNRNVFFFLFFLGCLSFF